MKIHFLKDETQSQDEITIRYAQEDEVIEKLKKYVQDINKEYSKIELYKGDVQYFVTIDKILFFETEDAKIMAHTKDDMYISKYKLYELEELLPEQFLRVSKSTIVNAKHVYSIDKNVTSSSCIKFSGTHKYIYVSRRYYKDFKNKVVEMRKR